MFKRQVRTRQAILAAVGSIVASAAALPAATVTWDPNHTPGAPGSTGGTGHWDMTSGGATANWANGGSDTTFTSGDNAWIGNILYTGTSVITLDESITAGTLTFDANNTTINLDGNNLTAANATTTANVTTSSLIFTSQTPATLTLATQQNTSRFRWEGAGLSVVLNATGTFGLQNSSTFGGSLTLGPATGSVYTVQGNSGLGASGNTVNANANTILAFDSTTGLYTTISHNFNLTTGARMYATSGKAAIITGSITGSLNYPGALSAAPPVPAYGAHQGMLVLAGSNNFTGDITSNANSFSLVLAHDDAIVGATSITDTSSSPWTLGFMGDAEDNKTEITSTINVFTGTGSAPPRGEGNVHNYSGNNSFSGNIVAGSSFASPGATLKAFGAEPNTKFTLHGLYKSTRGLQKFGAGTVVLTNQNAYGTNNGTGLNETYIGAGTLSLDFSQATWETSPNVQTNIVNNGLTTTTTGNTSSELILAGGTLLVKGKSGYTNTQNFKNFTGAATSATNAFTIRPGASSVVAEQNSATSLTIGLGKLYTSNRNAGGTIDFTLPTTGSIVLPTAGVNSVGTNGTIITSNGSAFGTVGKTDWAALDAGGARTIVGGSSLGGFYTANDGTTLAGNANMSGGVNTTLAANATITSLRFADSTAARSVDVNGNILTTGGILVSSGVGNNPSSITGGSIRGAVGTTTTLQDLVVFQHNTGAALTIGSKIVDNTTATHFTKSGAGTVILTADNSTGNGGYTGTTFLNEGILKLGSANALGGGLLQIDGGVLGITSDFARSLGSTAGSIRFTGAGGFAAYTAGTLNVNFNAAVTWGGDTTGSGTHFIRTGEVLTVGAPDALGTVNFVQNMSLGASLTAPFQRTIDVVNSTSVGTEAKFSGNITSNAGIDKIGAGTMEIAGSANSFTGPVNIMSGGVILSGTTTSTILPPINVFNGATFQQTATSTHSGLLDVRTGGTAEVGGILSSTSAAAVTVAGDLTITGVGKILGTTTVNNGGVLAGASTPVSGRSLATVVVNSGGTIAPGFSAAILNTGSISLTSGATYEAELDGPTAGNGVGFHDQLNVAGTVNLNSDNSVGSTLLATLNYVPTLGDSLFIILNDGTDLVTGEFNGLGESDTIDLVSSIDSQTYRFAVSYVANGDAGATANDVSLTNISIPEPSGLSLLAAGVATLRRRRRTK